MEILKSLDQITQIDERNKFHGFTLADRHKQVSQLELTSHVPEGIASAFAVARNLWLFGWFCWPLYSLASFEAFRCIEMSLINRWRKEGCPELRKQKRSKKWKETPSLKLLLEFAVEKGLLLDSDFEHVRLHQETQRAYNELLVDILPEEPPQPSEPAQYVRILKDVLPQLRNRHAHAESIAFMGPSAGYLDLQNARDLIQKLFSASSTASPPPQATQQ